MTITTRKIALGIPPRLHQPKPTKASGTKATKTNKKNQKRVASESDEDDSSSDESELRVKKKRRKEQNKVSDNDVELVEDDVELPEKDVEDVDIELGIGDEQQVSRLFIVVGIDSLNPRMTVLMTSNMGLMLKHSL